MQRAKDKGGSCCCWGEREEILERVVHLFPTAVKLSHDDTGAKYLHLAREDTNNLFSMQFRTTPMDSTGVPHILEHTVLCGSRKYPCRDPFFKMLNRSLSTFMNAFTGRTSILNGNRVWVCQAPTGIQLVSEKG
ncbi:presequence protease, mitochondrial-like [Piliocolobus tephrosceles]|uniref:presequence protease, mitochondrial-like n=1 Tax=Piliocolobus tephrosceles TaxID=591936 RepID=UPI000E6AFB2F|nr:presequence protease, mitochondrial-like [Piliocolobus tephrosceles]